jgi:hypothetical protein
VGWASVGCYLLCCVADKREGELAGPKKIAQRGREKENLYLFFQFSCLKQFWLFAML